MSLLSIQHLTALYYPPLFIVSLKSVWVRSVPLWIHDVCKTANEPDNAT
jgi:hypothetical protein